MSSVYIAYNRHAACSLYYMSHISQTSSTDAAVAAAAAAATAAALWLNTWREIFCGWGTD